MLRTRRQSSEIKIQDDIKMILPFKKEIKLNYECQPDKNDCQCQLTSNTTKSQKNLEIVIGETNFLDFDLDIGNIGDDLAIGVNAKFDFDKLGFPISSRDGLKCEDRRGSFESGVSKSKLRKLRSSKIWSVRVG